MSLRFARYCLCLLALAALLPSCVLASEASAARFDAAECAAEAVLSSRGTRVTVDLTLISRSADQALTFVIRDIALNGECTGYTGIHEAEPGQTLTVRAVFQRSVTTPLTLCDIGVAVLDAAGRTLTEQTLTLMPFGESGVRRPVLDSLPAGTVALDHEAASLVILPESGPEKTLCFLNKSGRLLRLRIGPVYRDGQLTPTSLTLQALPGTLQYAAITLDGDCAMTLTGYAADSGESPVFSAVYNYSAAAPRSVATLVPAVTPRPQIGTVTVRKSGPVNVREGDSTDARKIGSAQAGKTYPCFGISPAGWYLIRLDDGTEGYITNTLTTFQRQ